jgi:myo-inositol 2-dehydrogenase / D-chiro-inositol 1-dehydrogenase
MTAPSNNTSKDDVTRREFVKTSAGVAVAAGVAGGVGAAPLIARTANVAGLDTIKVGLIGCGGRGTGAASQAMHAEAGTVMWAMADIFPGRIDDKLGHLSNIAQTMESEGHHAARSDKIQVTDDRKFLGFDAYEKLLKSGVDVVLMATPPVFRPTHLRAAVEANKHVFCEKPVAVDAPGIRSVLETTAMAEARGLSLMSGFCWRHHDQLREGFGRLLNGGIGDVHTVQSTYNAGGWVATHERQPGWSDTEFQLRNWQYFTPFSGDHIVEQGIHAVDWIAWANGDVMPINCTAVGGRSVRKDIPETGNVYDHFSVMFEFANGGRGYHMCRHWPNSKGDNTAYVLGSKGTYTMKPWRGVHEMTGATPWKGTAKKNDMYQTEHNELFEAIRSGNRFDDGVRMAHSTLMAIMGRMAAYTGRQVTWEDALNSEEDMNPGEWTWADRPFPAVAKPGTTKFF